MADLITIETEEVRDLLKRLAARLTRAQLEKVALRLGELVAVAAESRARQYPKVRRKKLEKIYTLTRAFGRPTKPYQSIFKSDKQAAFVMLGIRDGKIILPYQRTGTLGKSITHHVEVIGNRIEITVGTNLSYAKPVIGKPPDQSFYHRGNWTPLEESISSPDARNEYNTILKTNLNALIAGLLKGG